MTEYYKGDGGFQKVFAIKQNKGDYAIDALTGPVVKWGFEDRDGNKKEITWTGTPTGSPVKNRATFDVPENFFNVVTTYQCQLLVYDSGILVFHSKRPFTIDVLKPKIEKT